MAGTEQQENGPRGFTPIIEGDWKVNVHSSGGGTTLGFRRYHKHSGGWYYVIPITTGTDEMKCSKCGEHVPEEMEGYIKLARWSEGG